VLLSENFLGSENIEERKLVNGNVMIMICQYVNRNVRQGLNEK